MFKDEKKEVFTVSDVTGRVKRGLGNGRGTLILAIAGTAVSLCASFMFCLASIGFDFTQLGETVFWSRWASMAVATMCVYAVVLLHKDEVNRMKDWYVNNLKTIGKKSETAGEEFEKYLKELNMNRRIAWYKRKMNTKIAKLNQKLFWSELKRQKPYVKKRVAKIKAKIEKYESRVTKQYIDEHKDTLKTRSKPISSVQVLSETQRGDSGEVNFRSASAYYGGKSIVKVCLSLAITAAFSCVVVTNFEAGVNIASAVMTVLTVLSLFISAVSAILAANGCYKNVYVPNLLFKLKILSDYETWRNDKKGKPQEPPDEPQEKQENNN